MNVELIMYHAVCGNCRLCNTEEVPVARCPVLKAVDDNIISVIKDYIQKALG